MGRNMPLAFAAALALAGCGQLWPAGGNSAAETVNAAPTGNGIVFTGDSGQSTDAGITDQQTLAGLMGNVAGNSAAENMTAPEEAEGATPPADALLPGKPPAPVEEARARPVGIDPALLIGTWGDNGDCSKGIELRGDGTFVTYTGAVGNWSLNGRMLTMSGQNGSFRARLRAVDGAHLLVVNQDGSIGRSQRC